ncbi:MAG: hypothetical protein V2I33_25645 [Kangiellaceae bacterium]|nr:hypothetical protein [Kangiellaceae bacterium]
MNDIVIPDDETTRGKAKRNFVIKYEDGLSGYTLCDIEGTGTFVKIDSPTKLVGTRIVSFGDTHMVVKATSDSVVINFADGEK